MTMTGLWQQITKMFEAETGYQIEVVVTGPRPVLDAAMRAGKVDLLTMHSGDITTDLVADGYGVDMRPWACNELCIVGPPDDPAHIRGMTNGVAALQKIAAAKAHFVDFADIGSRELVHKLWGLSGVSQGELDTSGRERHAVEYFAICASNDAYVVVGYIPAKMGRMPANGMEILVKDDPVMRRPFIVMETNPKKFPQANYAGAKALSDFLFRRKRKTFCSKLAPIATVPARSFIP